MAGGIFILTTLNWDWKMTQYRVYLEYMVDQLL